MQTYDFIPVDTLFCRDSRPLAAGVGFGHGANWPLPSTLHEALRSGLLRSAGLETLNEKGQLVIRSKSGRQIQRFVGTTAFDWLHLHGPFPVDDSGETWFPTPRDLSPGRSDGGTVPMRHRLIPAQTDGSLTNISLRFVPACGAHPTKDELPRWMPAHLYSDYLSGERLRMWKSPSLWDTEHRIGISIAADTHSTVKSRIYAAEHLRLRDDVRLRFAVNAPNARQRRPRESCKTVADLVGGVLTLGGERRFGAVARAAAALTLPDVSSRIRGVHVKWVLLTPAVFAGGWLPGWIELNRDAAAVRIARLPDPVQYGHLPTREERRAAMQAAAQPIRASLLAACVGKPLAIAGWDLLSQGRDCNGDPTGSNAKPTYLAVPSGSVYYFEAADEPSAELLVRALQGRCRSDFFGEKGLGLGVCGLSTCDDLTPRSPANEATTQP